MFQPPIELRPSDSLVNHYPMDISGRETDIALYLEKIYLEDSINQLVKSWIVLSTVWITHYPVDKY